MSPEEYKERLLKAEIGIGLSEFFIDIIDKGNMTTDEFNKLHKKHTNKIYHGTKGIFKKDI